MRRVQMLAQLILALSFSLALPAIASAQLYHGRVAGTVQDSSGAVIVGADVKLTSADIGLERTTTTNSAGDFSSQA